ncbi:glucosyltransferase domain-containing protein [Aliiglaciecola sp. 2_MG-2023]|uniref:glucosyltransferase domain-containing protein n=1 Tax=unclassified Aliiglaciecola TaxID=2593648 RepID=UPI0026E334CA|nr:MULTISPECIES: glucosyltransferase domain-containing protein [unclassified Aliiglaciecola]MDO6710318.1 glucosyltransferase domain-containing protein [Aliiglaciecola sp. 2_MG-2023]MDO6751466.1 glucosyltransferase domain-containing protein [Aliiglaciecola sp. 1_MG-2023]
MSGISPFDQLRFGRWFVTAILSLNFFKQIPVLILLISILFQVSSGLLAAYLLEINSKTRFSRSRYLVAGLLVSIIPFVSAHHYYTFMSHVFPAAQLLVIASMLVGSLRVSFVSIASGAILFMLSMATYQASINTYAVLFCGVVIVRLVNFYEEKKLRENLIAIASLSSIFVFGAIFYKVSLVLCDQLEWLETGAYQLESLQIADIPERLEEVVESSIRQLVISQPYFPFYLKLLALTISIVGGITLLIKLGIRQRLNIFLVRSFILGVICFLMLFATKTQFLLSADEGFYYYRFASFGISYFYLFFFMMLPIDCSPKCRIPILIACAVLFYSFWVYDLSQQKDMVKQNHYDFSFVNRIIARLEQSEDFSYERSYKLIQVGEL